MKREEKIKLEQLFKIMKQGNNEVIQELYKRYNKIVYGIAFSILKNKEDSEDVVQKVFLKLYNIDERKLPKEKAGTWLYSVTKNEALTILRKKYDDISLENIYNCENANDEISDFIDKESYNKIISKLSEKEQK
ncbi:MAG: sigma-70 family RNA polymerase sigma factor, partial [Bacilli bacterium]|nr:sigma-70 family RNA polymerase sigma factor [Bacilli bacterium]